MRERRCHSRLKRSLRIFWNQQEVQCAGITLDICPGGIFVVTCVPVEDHARLELEIATSEQGTPMRCCGEVAWVNRGQITTFPPGFGLKFIDLDRSSAEVLSRLCTEKA